MAKTKLPSFQWYPGDWMKDPAVRSCSLAARGLWTDMLCLMFESPRRGFLQQANGTPLSNSQIARMTGCDSDEAAHLLQELENAGVFSRTEHGVIFSRRIVRDERRRMRCSENGRKGGNPALLGKPPDRALDIPLVNRGVNPKGNQTITPSSSISTSTSVAKPPSGPPQRNRTPAGDSQLADSLDLPKSLDVDEFRRIWRDYLDWIAVRDGRRLDAITGSRRLMKLSGGSVAKAIADLELTICSAKHTGTIWDSARGISKLEGPTTFAKQRERNNDDVVRRAAQRDQMRRLGLTELEIIGRISRTNDG